MLIQGTNISAPVVPNDSNDVFASHEAKYGKGGWRTVADIAERDAITIERRENLMPVAVEADSTIYQFVLGTTSLDFADNGNWVKAKFGGGAGGPATSITYADALAIATNQGLAKFTPGARYRITNRVLQGPGTTGDVFTTAYSEYFLEPIGQLDTPFGLDDIVYDLVNDWVGMRRDQFNNEVWALKVDVAPLGYAYPVTIDQWPWGNPFVTNNRVYASVFGSTLLDGMANGPYNYISNNVLQGVLFNNVTLHLDYGNINIDGNTMHGYYVYFTNVQMGHVQNNTITGGATITDAYFEEFNNNILSGSTINNFGGPQNPGDSSIWYGYFNGNILNEANVSWDAPANTVVYFVENLGAGNQSLAINTGSTKKVFGYNVTTPAPDSTTYVQNGMSVSTTKAPSVTSVKNYIDAADTALQTQVTANTNNITSNTNTLATKANIASPTFTGSPKAPTAGAGTNSTQIATTAFVANSTVNKVDKSFNNQTFLGYNAGGVNNVSSGGDGLTFIGSGAGKSNYTNNQTFVGVGAGTNTTSGPNNTFIGCYAGQNNTTGQNNAVFGHFAGRLMTVGSQNLFIGSLAGQSTSGSYNTFMGFNAGGNNTTGSFNIALGNASGPATGALTNTISIGDSAQATTDNTMYVTNSVKVGIGVQAPTSKLTVNGDIEIQPGFNYIGRTPNGTRVKLMFNDDLTMTLTAI